MTKAKILYVEDDEVLSYVTKDNLELNGYDVVHCTNGKSAVETYKDGSFDLCLFDVMLPEMDGFELAKRIRKINHQIPILFLTAKAMKEDKIEGLRLGGDDYITKPFSIEELLLRIGVFLRRRQVDNMEANDKLLNIGAYTFDYEGYKLIFQDTVKDLTQKEADLLYLLASNPEKIIKRQDILEKLWGENDYFLGRSMDVFISRLRKYLSEDDNILIENIHGVGFRFLIK